MGKYTPRTQIPIPEDGEEVDYDGQTGPISVDPGQVEDPAVNWGDALQTVAYALDATRITRGPESDRPSPGSAAPVFWLVTASAQLQTPALTYNTGTNWTLVAGAGGTGEDDDVPSQIAFEQHVSDFDALQTRVSNVEDNVSDLQNETTSLNSAIGSVRSRVSAVETELSSGDVLYRQEDQPSSPDDGDWWLDTSQVPSQLHWYDQQAGTFVIITTDGGGGGGGGTNQRPTASFSFSPGSPTPGDTVTFDAGPSGDPDGEIQSYEWDFTADGMVDATSEQAETSYSEPGQYTVSLTVVDDAGATGTALQSITVEQKPAVLLDSWEHRNHQDFYSEINNSRDWRYVTDAIHGDYALECDSADSRYMTTFPGDGLGYPEPGQTIQLWFKPNGGGGQSNLFFATAPNNGDPNHDTYDLYYNADLNNIVLWRYDDGQSDEQIARIDNPGLDVTAWYAFEVGWYPDGQRSLPWQIIDRDGDVVIADPDCRDETGRPKRTGSALGWGVRSNSTRTRFDYARATTGSF